MTMLGNYAVNTAPDRLFGLNSLDQMVAAPQATSLSSPLTNLGSTLSPQVTALPQGAGLGTGIGDLPFGSTALEGLGATGAAEGGAAVPGLFAGAGAIPLIGSVAGGIGLGQAFTGSKPGNEIVNAMRDASSNPLANIVANTNPVAGLIHSAVGLLGNFGIGPQGTRTNDSLADVAGTGSTAQAADLSPQGLQAKFDSFGLSGTTRAQAVAQFNSDVQSALAAGATQQEATQGAYNAMFGKLVDDGQGGKVAQGGYMAQLQAANQQTQAQAQQAAALQALVANVTPDALAPMQHTRDAYNSLMSSVIPQLPGYLQPVAALNAANMDAAQARDISATQNLYTMLPTILAQQQSDAYAKAVASRLQSQAIAAQYPSQNAVSSTPGLSQTQAASGQ